MPAILAAQQPPLGITRNNEIDEIKNGQEKIQDIKEKEE